MRVVGNEDGTGNATGHVNQRIAEQAGTERLVGSVELGVGLLENRNPKLVVVVAAREAAQESEEEKQG